MNEIPRHLLKYSDEIQETKQEKEDRENVEKADENFRRSLNRFQRYFAYALDAAQMSAANELANCFEIRSTFGNAKPAYDGIPAPEVFESKEGYSRASLQAGIKIESCEKEVRQICGPYDYWELLKFAILENKIPEEIGERCNQMAHKPPWSDRHRRRVGREVIIQATTKIIPVFNKRS